MVQNSPNFRNSLDPTVNLCFKPRLECDTSVALTNPCQQQGHDCEMYALVFWKIFNKNRLIRCFKTPSTHVDSNNLHDMSDANELH